MKCFFAKIIYPNTGPVVNSDTYPGGFYHRVPRIHISWFLENERRPGEFILRALSKIYCLLQRIKHCFYISFRNLLVHRRPYLFSIFLAHDIKLFISKSYYFHSDVRKLLLI